MCFRVLASLGAGARLNDTAALPGSLPQCPLLCILFKPMASDVLRLDTGSGLRAGTIFLADAAEEPPSQIQLATLVPGGALVLMKVRAAFSRH